MDIGFINILKQLVKEQGSAALTDAKRVKALLADYTKNEYRKQSRAIVDAVESGVAKKIDGAEDLAACKKAQIRELEDEYGLSTEFATNIVNALALVLRGDTTVTVSLTSEKAKTEVFSSSSSKQKLTYPNGDVYEGDVVNGKANGKGKWIQKNGNVYEGDFVNDRWQGKGRQTCTNGEVYEGDWVDGNRHGKGKTTWPDGDVYEGDFVDGKYHGKGKYTWANGNVYEGDWANDKRHGKGKMIYRDGWVQEGNWENGEFKGK